MAKPVWMFVSCSPHLEAEREVVGQIVAALPVSVGWEVRYTPVRGENSNTGLDFISISDVFVVLLGHDFAAPMGSEWSEALRFNKKPLAYRKSGTHSPSAQMHLRESRVRWQPFESAAELRTMLTRSLAHVLLDRGERFGLHLEEVEGLLEILKSQEEARHEDDSRSGAGRGAVILGRGNL